MAAGGTTGSWLLGGSPAKGTGFAIVEDRLILSLQQASKAGMAQGRDVYIARMGLRVELPPAEQKFGKALAQADRLGTKCALILGDDEIASGQLTLKSLADGRRRRWKKPKFWSF